MESTDTKITTVQNLYAAYGRGDIAGAVADLADDVDWAAEAAGDAVPWYGNYHGKSEVPGFFAAIHDSVTVTQFDVVSCASNDTDVIATVRWTYTVNRTGRTASMYMQHWFRFADGKIVFFRGSEDSGQSIAAFA
jgi:ketosteroid isomerase-like protein